MKPPILPEDVLYILQQLNQNGFEAYIVGGCVRDCILGRQPMDWDITTSAEPHEVKAIFPHTFDTGIQHGTVTVVKNKINYEVTTYRVEGEYEDCRHPSEVEFTKKLEEDLLRRDFTMNAIAYHPDQGFQDFFHGMEDISSQTIRGVGVPAERFQEDALRMLRALRFSVQLGFTIEQNTYKALKENRALIQKISVERIHEELDKLLAGVFFEKMSLLWESELLYEISPVLQKNMVAEGSRVISQLKQAQIDMEIRWTLFLQHMSEKEAKSFLKKLKFDTKTLRGVTQLIQLLSLPLPKEEYPLRKLIGQIGAEKILQLIELKALLQKEEVLQTKETTSTILERKDCLTLKELKFTGEDLISMGVPKGKEIGKILGYLLDLVHQDPTKNEKFMLHQYAERYWKSNSFYEK